jgi:stalled ribosome rescue protein Dom34
MEAKKLIGIWMDHSTANLIDLNTEKNNSSIISDFNADVKKDALNRSESLMHNKRQQMHKAYYKEISEEILKFNHILLFGPTNAKTELHNYLNEDLRFKDITIDIETADDMTVPEKEAFVKSHFKN